MGLVANSILKSAIETVRGTAVTTTVTHDLEGSAFHMGKDGGAYEGKFTSAFPQMARVIKTSRKHRGQLVTPILSTVMQAQFEMGFKRTSGALDSFTFDHKEQSSGEQSKYAGCVCDQMVLEWGSNDDPVRLSYDIEAMSLASTSGITAGTYQAGNPLMGHRTLVTVGGTSYTVENLSGRLTIANNLIVGPAGADGFPKFIRDGFRRVSLELQNSHDSSAIGAIFRGVAITPIVLVFASGTGTETLTITLPEVHIIQSNGSGDVDADEEYAIAGIARKPSGADECQPAYSIS